MNDKQRNTDISPTIQYIGNGSSKVFPFPFEIFKATDIEVYINQIQMLSGFTVEVIENVEGGNITFSQAPNEGAVITLMRNLEFEVQSTYTEGGAFRPEVLNREFSHTVGLCQQLKENVSRCLQLPVWLQDIEVTLPEPNPGKTLIWNKAGTGWENSKDNINDLLTNTTIQANISIEKARIATEQAQIATVQAAAALASATSAATTVNGFDGHAANTQAVYDANAAEKLGIYNNNASDKLSAYNANATDKLEAYNKNTANKVIAFNQNAVDRTSAFDANSIEKTEAYNSNTIVKLKEYNDNHSAKKNVYDSNAEVKLQAVNNSAIAASQSAVSAAQSAADALKYRNEAEQIANLPEATETVRGVSALATAEEAANGEENKKVITPATLKVVIENHTTRQDNPHQVTAEQIGLGAVDNTPDCDKPISNATAAALEGKQDTITGAASSIVADNLTPSSVLISDPDGKIAASGITIEKLDYLSDVVSPLQEQLNGKASPAEIVNYKPEIVTLPATSGTIALEIHKIYRLVLSDATTFLLPVPNDLSVFLQIKVMLKVIGTPTINWGTSNFFNKATPEIEAGFYDIYFDYDPEMASWVVGAMPKGSAS